VEASNNGHFSICNLSVPASQRFLQYSTLPVLVYGVNRDVVNGILLHVPRSPVHLVGHVETIIYYML
jgi:hypothetical protein